MEQELEAAIAKYSHLSWQGVNNATANANREIYSLAEATFPALVRQALMQYAESEVDRQLIEEWSESFTETWEGTRTSVYQLGPAPEIPKKLSGIQNIMEAGVMEDRAQAVRDWVQAGYNNDAKNNADGKVFDGRDDWDTLEEVIHRMQWILVWAGKNKPITPAIAEARATYSQFINAFTVANEKLGKDRELAKGIDVRTWCRIVLQTWIRYVQRDDIWPAIVWKQLEKEGLPK